MTARAEQLRLARAIGEQAGIEGAALVGQESTLAVGQQVVATIESIGYTGIVEVVSLDQEGVRVPGSDIVFAVAPGDCKAVAP